MKSHDTPNVGSVLRGSYVLRLWRAQSGVLYGYVLDVRSGVRHPLRRLDELSSVIRSIISESSVADIASDPGVDRFESGTIIAGNFETRQPKEGPND